MKLEWLHVFFSLDNFGDVLYSIVKAFHLFYF